MNKSLIISICGFTLLILFSIITQSYIESSSSDLSNNVDNLIENLDSNNLNSYNKSLNEAWKNKKKLWAILIDHSELDSIEETLKRIEILSKAPEERIELEAELNKLKFYFKHISEKDRFVIENIM